MSILAALPALPRLDVPVDPDSPTAQDWIRRELAKAEYQTAKPSPLADLWQRIQDWLNSLQAPAISGGPPIWLFVLLLVVVALVVIGLLVFGLPRRNRRSAGDGSALFGDDDLRDAAELRRSAAAAADSSDWRLAVIEQFRAIVRGLGERAVLSLAPGTTAHDAATRAGAVFPAQRDGLEAGARDFDLVRYLGGQGRREQWEALRGLDRALQSAKPDLDASPALDGFVPVGGSR